MVVNFRANCAEGVLSIYIRIGGNSVDLIENWTPPSFSGQAPRSRFSVPCERG